MTSGTVSRIGTGDEVDVIAVPGGTPSMITAGPDDAMWFTLNRSSAVGRVDMTGKLSIRSTPTPAAGPVGITATHDDAVWFTEIQADRLGRIPMNEAIQELELPGKPHAVVADQADGVWVSLWESDQIARVSADGEVTTIDLPAGSEPHGLLMAADGGLWVALEAGYVLRLPVG